MDLKGHLNSNLLINHLPKCWSSFPSFMKPVSLKRLQISPLPASASLFCPQNCSQIHPIDTHGLVFVGRRFSVFCSLNSASISSNISLQLKLLGAPSKAPLVYTARPLAWSKDSHFPTVRNFWRMESQNAHDTQGIFSVDLLTHPASCSVCLANLPC